MMAGPISDTIAHSDEDEIVTVSPGASKALEYDELQALSARKARAAAKPAAGTAPTAKAKASTGSTAAQAPKISNTLAAPRGGTPDRLTQIKGIGPVNERKLNEHGIFHFDQIAAWKKADVQAAETYLAFDGRIEREGWVSQAKALAKAAAKPAAPKGGRG
jgi:branched-chain amino acid transport system ATP-binding protein